MKFTIGIITSNQTSFFLNRIIESIVNQKRKDDVEIIIVGGDKSVLSDCFRVIPFDETVKNKWITKKKNIITENAKYENIVYMHDYLKLEDGWFDGFEAFGEEFSVCMNPILNENGKRFRDWCFYGPDVHLLEIPDSEFLIPYHIRNLSKLMYISGSYWVAKKHIMEKYPLNESLCWGESEDIEWSKRVRGKYDFSLNTNSKIKALKLKATYFINPSPKRLEIIERLNNETIYSNPRTDKIL